MSGGIQKTQHVEELTGSRKKIENYLFKLTDKIGQGNFSEVFKGINTLNSATVAIKIIKYSSITSKVAENLLKNQVGILRQLNHPNIIKCLDIFTSTNNCYIVTEYCEGGDIQRFLSRHKKFNQKDIGKMIYQIYKGLAYLEGIGVIHRDLKIANIFRTADGTPKIADFGFAVKANQPFRDISIGSPIYMSPEGMLLHEYGRKTDVWAFGIMIYELLHGQTPLSGCKSDKQLKQKILQVPNFRTDLTPDLKYLLDRCLAVDPKTRIDLAQIANIPYMSKLIQEYEGYKISKEMDSTFDTRNSTEVNILNSLNYIKNYDEGLAVLHYCRLIHKTTQITACPILSQWLLNICWHLRRIRPQQGSPEKLQKLHQTINKYYTKYQKQHHDERFNVRINDVMTECERIKANNNLHISKNISKMMTTNINLLIQETNLIKKSMSQASFLEYSKVTQIEKYLESLKNSEEKRDGFGLYRKSK